MFNERAKIAACEVNPPKSVTKALTFALAKTTVSAGVKVSVTTTTSPVILDTHFLFFRFLIILFLMKRSVFVASNQLMLESGKN